MKLLSIVFVTLPLTMSLQNDLPAPKSIKAPRCSSHSVPHSVPHFNPSPHNAPHSPSPSPGQFGNHVDDIQPRPIPHIPEAHPTPSAGHAIAPTTDDQAAQVKKQFSDTASRLSTSRLPIAQRSFYRYLDLPVERPRLLSLMPSDEQSFGYVYSSRTYSAANKRSLEAFKANLDALGQTQVERAVTRADLELAIQNADSRPIVVFGHTERSGTVLVLPSGEKVHVNDVHAYCQALQRACMVLTCEGEDFGIQGRLVATHAVKMWEQSVEAIASTGNRTHTVRDFRDQMIKARASTRVAEAIALSVVTSGSAGGATFIVSSVGDRDSRKRSTTLETLRTSDARVSADRR